MTGELFGLPSINIICPYASLEYWYIELFRQSSQGALILLSSILWSGAMEQKGVYNSI